VSLPGIEETSIPHGKTDDIVESPARGAAFGDETVFLFEAWPKLWPETRESILEMIHAAIAHAEARREVT
jgi:hypothetical protein